MKALSILLTLLLSGCIPINKTVQPRVELSVKSSSNLPVTGATVKIATYYCAMGRCNPSVNDYMTDELGRAKIEAIKEKGLMVLIGPDVSFNYIWSLCVEKKSYVPFIAKDMGGFFGKNDFEVILEESDEIKTCELDFENNSFKII